MHKKIREKQQVLVKFESMTGLIGGYQAGLLNAQATDRYSDLDLAAFCLSTQI